MLNPLLVKSYVAGGAIPARSIVKLGADDNTVVVGAAATDSLLGVVENFDFANSERRDVVMYDIAEIELGGAVTRGGPVTANGSGQGVAAAPAAGVNSRLIGFALASGVANDMFSAVKSRGLQSARARAPRHCTPDEPRFPPRKAAAR